METLGVEAIISLVLAGLALIVTFIGHYFYVRGKLHKAAAGAITNAEQDDKTGEEKLELAVDQVYGLVPASLKVFIHRSSVRKIVQAAFDKIEDYAKKQVEKKSKKKEEDGSSADANDESESAPQSEIIVSPQSDEFSDSGGEHEKQDEENNEQSNSETDWQTLDDMISLNADVRSEIAATTDDTAPDEQSDNQVKQSRACSINKNSNQEKNIMENNNINNVIDNEPVTCYEDIGAGTEYSKQFTNPKTGLHTAVLFSSPIDNNDGISTASDGDDFIDAVNDEGEEVYENRRNKFLIRLAKSTAQNKLVELIQDDYKIAMSPVAAVTSKLNRFVGTIRRDIQAIRNLRRDPKAAKSKITELIHGAVKFALKDREPSDIRFANIINNCDLEYLVESNRLKEYIIVNAKSEAYEYLFNLNLGKLEARMSGKQIELYDAATNEVKFLIPAPYMYDMANEKSDAVEYMLEGSAGNYTLRVIADETWINADARQFPVVIDPQIMGNTTSIISMGEYNNGNILQTYGDKISLGCNYYDNKAHIYELGVEINAKALKESIGSQVRVAHAILELTKADGGYQPNNSQGFSVSSGNKLVDKFTYNGSNNRIDIDITALIQDAVVNSNNVKLRLYRNATDNTTDFIVLMTDKAYVSEYRPRLFIDFVSSRLETEEMAYSKINLGRAGLGTINYNTLGVKWEHPDFTVRDGALSLPISHVYNSGMAEFGFDAIMKGVADKEIHTDDFGCGKGFKLNIHQRLINKKPTDSANIMGSNVMVYIDGQGNHHDFVEKYYYMKDNYAHYVDRSECSMKANGDIIFDDNGILRDINYEIANELGMTIERYSHYINYLTSDLKYVTNHYYVVDGKRCYVECDGNYADVPVYYYTASNGRRVYVLEPDVQIVNGHYKTVSGITVVREIQSHFIQNNQISIIRTEITNSIYNDRYITFDLKEERVYEDKTAITATDYISTDEIEELNQKIKACENNKDDILEQVKNYEKKCEKYNLQISQVNELRRLNNLIYTAQLNSQDKLDKQQIDIKSYQREQLEYQFMRQMLGNALYCDPKERFDAFPIETVIQFSGGGGANLSQVNANYIKQIKSKLGSTNDLNVLSQTITSAINKYKSNSSEADKKYDAQQEYNREITELQIALDNLSFHCQANLLDANKNNTGEAKNQIILSRDYSNATFDEQIRQLNEAIAEIEETINKLNDNCKEIVSRIDYYLAKRSELINEQKRHPTDFITTTTGKRLGFDYYGRLVLVQDAYENQIYFIYDNDNRLSRIVNKDNDLLLLFNYSGDLLDKMTDSFGRTIKLEYEYGKLTQIIHHDGAIAKFNFDNSGRIVRIDGISGNSISLIYSVNNIVVQENTTVSKISASGIEKCNEKIINSYEIKRTSLYSSTVNNSKGEIRYIFDRMGRVITVYSAEDNIEHSASYEYSGLDRAFSCGNALCGDNLVNNADFSNDYFGWTIPSVCVKSISVMDNRKVLSLNGSSDCYAKQEIYITEANRSLLPQNGVMVFSSWAKANSLPVLHNKRQTAYGKDVFSQYEIDAANSSDTLRQARRFGMFASVEYTDSSMNEYFECTYDFYNFDWQMAVLPVRIKDSSRVTKITLLLDYAYNDGNVYFAQTRFSKCKDYISKVFDADHRVISEFDGKKTVEYEYDGMYPTKSITFIGEKKYESKMRYNRSGALLYSHDHNGNCVENIYNDQGVLIKTVKYNENDSTSKYVQEYKYDNNGNLVSEVDSRGEVNGELLKTDYEYDRGLKIAEKYPDNQKVVYGYDYDTDTQTGMSSDDDGEANSTVYKFTKEMLTTVSHNDIDVDYSYDCKGRTLETKIAKNSIVTNVYADRTTASNVDTVTSTYANGTIVKNITDSRGRIQYVDDITNGISTHLLHCEYDGNTDRHSTVMDSIGNITYSYSYTNDKLTQTSYNMHSNNVLLTDFYNNDELLINSNITIGGVTEQYNYAYDETPEHKLQNVVLPSNIKQTLGLDALGRPHEISQIYNGKVLADENRYYLKYGDRTTDYISSVRFGVNGNLNEHIRYKYDKTGNISEIYKNGILTNRYVYDKLNHMIREDNKEMACTSVFIYDVGGNILGKSVYDFTLGSLAEKTPISVLPYSYKAMGWRDQLTAYNAEKCEYDVMGNPTIYRDNVLVWSKYGTLTSYGNNSYTYDANGVRLTKTVNGVITKFYISGTKILRMTVDANELRFRYGVSGVQGLSYNGQEYIYRKNIQGDITHIYKISNGTLELAAEYKYDAWGNHSVINYDGNSIGDINPIRYRGYYYDTETKLYYLNARYYDPETGRFISADDTQFINANIVNGVNLYAYCLCDPINKIDKYGNTPVDFIKTGVDLLAKLFNHFGNSFLATSKQFFKYLSHISMYVIDEAGGAVFNSLYLTVGNFATDMEYTAKVFSTAGKALKVLGYALLVVDIGLTIYDNFTNPDLPMDRKITDTLVDIGYIALSSFASWAVSSLAGVAVGAMFGSVVPGIGTVVGAIVGLVVSIGMSIATYFGDWYQNVKDAVYEFFTVTIPEAWDKFVDGWNWFWSFSWI